MVDIPSVCRVPALTSSTVTHTILFRSVVTKNCVWKPVRLKTECVVMWATIFGEVMSWSAGGALMKERESVPTLDCEVFTLQRAGADVKKRGC